MARYGTFKKPNPSTNILAICISTKLAYEYLMYLMMVSIIIMFCANFMASYRASEPTLGYS